MTDQSLQRESRAFKWFVVALLVVIPAAGLSLAGARDPMGEVPNVAIFTLLMAIVFTFGVRTPVGILVVGSLMLLAVGGSWFALVVRSPDQELAGLWVYAANGYGLLIAVIGAAADTGLRLVRGKQRMSQH